MQRHLLASNFTLISILSVLSGIPSAQASTVRETTDFDQLGHLTRVTETTPLIYEGSVQNNDSSDIIKFTPSPDVSTVKISFSSASAAYTIVEDVNNSGRVDSGDRSLVQQTTQNPGKPIRVVFGKTYLAEVVKRNNGSTYRLSLEGAKAQVRNRLLEVKIISGRAIQGFGIEGRGADMLPQIFIERRLYEGRKISGDNTPTFNFGVRQEVAPDKEAIELSLRFVEKDDVVTDGLSGTGGDYPDVSPDPAERTLKLRYFPRTGEIFGPGNRRLGVQKQPITATGDSNQLKASITFTVNHSDVVF
jgi:hypothetical protein